MKTGDVRGAGTDANVYVMIFGESGDTGKLQLRQADNTKDKWERGRTDMFTLEAMDIGKVGGFVTGKITFKPVYLLAWRVYISCKQIRFHVIVRCKRNRKMVCFLTHFCRVLVSYVFSTFLNVFEFLKFYKREELK